MELVVAVAIGVLSLIFTSSLLALLIICRHKYCGSKPLDRKPILKYSREHLDAGVAEPNASVDPDLDDVLQLSPNIAKVLKDNEWVQDASGLVLHCLAILKSCHQITDKLSVLSFTPVHANQASMDQMREVTRRVMPRVDDLVRTMYLCTRKQVQAPLLEARAAALVMAVSSMAIAFRAAYPQSASAELSWLRCALNDMDEHLDALRVAALNEESAQRETVQVLLEDQTEGSDTTVVT